MKNVSLVLPASRNDIYESLVDEFVTEHIKAQGVSVHEGLELSTWENIEGNVSSVTFQVNKL